MQRTLSEIARTLGLTLKGEDLTVIGINTLDQAGPDEISFLANPKYAKHLAATRAGAIILSEEYADAVPRALISEQPYADFGRALALFARPQGSFTGISESAVIHPEAEVAQGATVYPFVYVGPRSRIEDGAVLFPGCYIGEDCVVGAGSTLYPQVSLMAGTVIGKRCILHPGAVLGADGFGFSREAHGIQKIPQVGTVRLGDDVEVGANTAIDRAVLGVTSVGDETKIDNLVQIGHNVSIGDRCFLVSQVGISGSTKVGHEVTMAGQVGVSGHLSIGDKVTIGPKSGVAKDIPAGITCGGAPVVEGRDYLRTIAVMPKLPDMYKRIGQLEKELAELRRSMEKETS